MATPTPDDLDRVLAHLRARLRSHPDSPATGLHDMSDEDWQASIAALRTQGHHIHEVVCTGGDRASNEIGYQLVEQATPPTTPTVIGVGYQGRDLTGFVTDLHAAGITLLVDVRLTPISRKRGFAKQALATALAQANIGYQHLPALGNPRTNRAGFAGDADELAAARRRYTDLLDEPAAQAGLDELAALSRTHRVAVLCFEADEQHCHRHVVLKQVRLRTHVVAGDDPARRAAFGEGQGG